MKTWFYGMAAVLAAPMVLAATDAMAAMTADQVRQQVERDSGGKVIKIEPRKYGALEAFAVTIINPGGNSNEAFQVYTVIINGENGMPVSEQRQGQHY